MGDPTGLSGILIGKSVDWLIEEAEIVINCQKNCRALKESLEHIKPLVDSAAKDLSAIEGETAVEEIAPVRKWLENLKKVVDEAVELVNECKTKRLGWIPRYRLSKRILNTQQKIQDIKVDASIANFTLNAKIVQGVAQIPDNMRIVMEEVFERQTDRILQTFTKDQRVGRSSDQSSSSQQTDQKALSRPIKGNTYGTDAPLKKLRQLLLNESKHNPYVGVCGTGGIGKTRLAELAYNSKDVRDHFTKTFWLTVGKDKSIKVLLRQLAEDLGMKISDDLEQYEIRTKVFHALSEEKVLLVLDDIWDKGDLIVKTLNVFSGLDTVSKILLTTRYTTILTKNYARPTTVWMKMLSGNDSWELFRENAFQGVDKIPTDVEKLAIDVANRCKGLPLALKVVAAALAGQESPQEWKRALKRLEEAELLDESNELYNRLQLSYDHLVFKHDDDPYRLQKCFIYFAAFPEDSDVDSEKLVRLWVGEKMLEDKDDTDDDNDPYIQGNLLLQELIARSLIELREDKWSENTNSRRLTCRIHDVLRDFARHLLREKSAPMDCLFSPGKDYGKFPDKWLKKPCRPGGLISNATHLSLNSTHCGAQDRIQSFLPDRLCAPTLEVLLLANIETDNFVIQPGFLESFSSLKVLDLERSLLYSLPESLGNLPNLTYLELSYTKLCKLPRGLRKLTNLEYLGLEGCERMEPFATECEIKCLKNLSTLNTRGCDRVWEALYEEFELDPMQALCSLTNLRSLSISSHDREHLPAQMSKLVNLRHLAIKFRRLKFLPPELFFNDGPKLSKLQYLSLSGCRELSEVPSWVGSLSHLQYLDLSSLVELRSLPNLSKLHHLRKLDLRHCIALTQLGEGFASAGAFLALEELYLERSHSLPGFPPVKEGAFPKLEALCIQSCKGLQQLGEGFASNRAFPALKELTLRNLQNLKEFPPLGEGAFPRLESFRIESSNGLEQLGEGFASKGAFPTLKELTLADVGNLKVFPPLGEGAFPKLECFRIERSNGLAELGEGFASKGAFPALKELTFEDLGNLKAFPPLGEGAFPKLECFRIERCNGLEELGEGFASKGAFPALKELTLRNLQNLKEFPPLGEGAFPKLESFRIEWSNGLEQLGEGFASRGAFPALKTLTLGDLGNLKAFPPLGEGAFPKLECFRIERCNGLEELGEGFASKGAFPALKELTLRNLQNLKEFPPLGEGAFPKLESFRIEWSNGLEQLGEGFGSRGAFPALKTLTLGDLGNLKAFPPLGEGAFPKLECFRIERCNGLEQLGGGFASKGAFPALKTLTLEDLGNMKAFPCLGEGAFPKLECFRIERCNGLEQLGEGFASKGAFPALKELTLLELQNVKEFPPMADGAFPKLESFRIEWSNGLEQLGEAFASKGAFPALKELTLADVGNLKAFPPLGEGAFTKLECFRIGRCNGLEQLGEGFASTGAFRALKELTLEDLGNLRAFPPLGEGAFPKLECFRIERCNGLEQLGKGFASKGAFPALKELTLKDLGNLKEFPPMGEGAFPKLESFRIEWLLALEQLGEGFASNGAFAALKTLTLGDLGNMKAFPRLGEGAFSKLESFRIKRCRGLEQLGEGFASKGAFPALKELTLEELWNLKEFPPVGEGAFPKLESFRIQWSQGLEQFGEGFASKGAFPALKELTVEYLGKLKEFPPLGEGAFLKLESFRIKYCIGLEQLGKGFASERAFPALKELILEDLGNLKEFPPLGEGAFPKLECFRIERCNGLEQLGEGFASKGAFPALKELTLADVGNLKAFPPLGEGAFTKLECFRIGRCNGLEQLGEGFASTGAFPALKELTLAGVGNLKAFPPLGEGALPKLECFVIEGFNGLEELGERFASKGAFPALKTLTLGDLGNFKAFPPLGEGAFPKLECFRIERCNGLEQLGGGFAYKGTFPALKTLTLGDLGNMKAFPCLGEGAFPKLECFRIERCNGLEQLGEGFASKGAFPALKELTLLKLQNLKEFPPMGDGAFPKLESFQIEWSNGLEQLGEAFASKGAFPALKELTLAEVGNLKAFPPLGEGAFTKLECFRIGRCNGLEQLGEGFASTGAFPALKELTLEDLENLKAFPPLGEGAFPKLECFRIERCNGLEQLGDGFASKGAFPALKELTLDYLGKLEEFSPLGEGAFPKLESFRMKRCRGLQQLGEGFASKGAFPALKELTLDYLLKLKEFPPLGEGAFPKLESFRIKRCRGLEQLGEGFASEGAFPALKELTLEDLGNLKEFPPLGEGAFPKLESFRIEWLIALEKLGEGFASDGAFPALKEVTLEDLGNLKEFPPLGEGAFPKLESFRIKRCTGLEQLGEGFASKGAFPALKELTLEDLENLKEFPPLGEGAFPKLESFRIEWLVALEQLGEGFASNGAFAALKTLTLGDLGNMKAFPRLGEGAFPKLESFRIKRCRGLEQLGEGFASKGAFPALKELTLEELWNLKEFPPLGEGAFPKLESFRIEWSKGLEQFGEGFASKGAFPALKELTVEYLGKLKEFPPLGEGAFLKLESFRIKHCSGLEQLGKGFASERAFPALKELILEDLGNLKEFPPLGEGAFPKLECFRIERCNGLEQLGEGFAAKGAFPALKELTLGNLEKLKECPPLGEEAFPKLESLQIRNCSRLEQLREVFGSKRAFPALKGPRRALIVPEGSAKGEGINTVEVADHFSISQPTSKTERSCYKLRESVKEIASKGNDAEKAPQDAENETARSGEDPEKQICQDQEDADKSQVWAQEASKEPKIMNEDHDAIALKGLVVADAKKLYVADQHYESNSSVGKLHNYLGYGKQQDFVRDFIREINRGESSFFVSKTWLFSLEEHERETLLSVLGRTGYFEFYQTRTTIIYRRIENNGEVPTVYNYLVRTPEANDVFNEETEQLLASNVYGDSDEIEEKGYSTETQDGKELGSGSQTERSNIVDSEMSTVSSFENKIQLAMVQTNDTSRLGSLRSLPDKGKTTFPGSNEKLESFKRALKDTGPYSYSVSTQWLSTLSDHEIEDVNIVLFKAGYSQIGKTSTTTYFKRPHDHVHNNPGHRSESSSTSERRTLVGDMERSSTFQGTEAFRAQKLLLDSDDTEVTSKIQARQRRKVDCGCLPQDMTVSCTPSSQGPVEPSTSSFQRGFSRHSTREPAGNCYVTMPRNRTQLTMDTGADKTEVMGTVEFDAEDKPYVKPVTMDVSADTSFSCCVMSDGNNRKVRFEFLKIQGAVRMEDAINLKTNALVLRAVRANVVAYIINAEKGISEVITLRILNDKDCKWPITLDPLWSIDEIGQLTKAPWMRVSTRDPIKNECGSKNLELGCPDKFWTDPEPESCNHELMFSDHDWRLMVEGDVQRHLDQNSFLELNLRYQLEYSLDEAVGPLPQDNPYVGVPRVTKKVDFGCVLEFRTFGSAGSSFE